MSTRIPAPREMMRKQPRQARSRATVDALVEAGAHVLGERGLTGFTTNEVAAVAGASIGSLYQYFPNKTALIEAIRRRHFNDVLAVLRSLDAGSRPFSARTQALARGMIAVHSIRPALHRVLLEEIPRRAAARSAHAGFESEYLRCYATVIEEFRGRRTGNDIAAQVLSSAIEGVIHNATGRGVLKSAVLERELVRLIQGYLTDFR